MKSIYRLFYFLILIALNWTLPSLAEQEITEDQAKAVEQHKLELQAEALAKCKSARSRRKAVCHAGILRVMCGEITKKATAACKAAADLQQAADEASKDQEVDAPAPKPNPNPQIAAADAAALLKMDEHLHKLTQISTEAQNLYKDVDLSLNQLSTDAKNPCLSASEFQQRKEASIALIHEIKDQARQNTEPFRLDPDSTTQLINDLNIESAQISSARSAEAETKKSKSQSLKTEADRSIASAGEKIKALEEMVQSSTGVECNSSGP